MTETATDTVKHRSNPLGPFMERILTDIIKPAVLNAAQAVKNDVAADPSKAVDAASIWRKFRELTSSPVSYSCFRDWLEKMGMEVKRTTTIAGL